jgi:hypothetical protein
VNGASISPLAANEAASWYGYGAYFAYTGKDAFDLNWYASPSGGLPVLRGFGGANDIGSQKIVRLQELFAPVDPPAKTSVTKITTGKKKMTVTWRKVVGVTKYELRYRAKGAKTWTVKTVSAKSTKLVIKKLKKNKRYQVQIRSYILYGGNKYYSKWSSTKTSGKIKG